MNSSADVVVAAPLRRLDAAILALASLLATVTFGLWLNPELSPSIIAPELDVSINVTATLVGGAVAILGWIRWQETGEPAALYGSAAFGALSTTNALTLGLTLAGRADLLGLDRVAPGEAPVYLWTLARLSAALLFVLGAWRGLRRSRPRFPPILTATTPAVLLVLVAAPLLSLESILPEPTGPGALIGPATGSTAFAAAQLAAFGLLIAAAVLMRRLFARDGIVSHAFLAAGLVVAAFSQLHFALDPHIAVGVVTSADVLRVLFHAILFLGIEAEIQADLGDLRRANSELLRLRIVDAANATLDERARLAREIHDGLAQDLWFAKLKQSRLAAAPELSGESRQVAQEVLGALDASLADARQAVMAMRVDPAAGSGLVDVLRAYVEDFADRFGLRVSFDVTGDVPRLGPRTEAELLRIVQEALNNVRKHADATLVRVGVERTDGRVRVSVADNGRGFDPDSVAEADRFGLRGMRERAELVGAGLAIRSRPADGTTVSVEVPVPSEAGAASAMIAP